MLAELKDANLQSVSVQLVGKARQLANQLGVNVEAILIGENTAKHSQMLIAAGADTVYLAESPKLSLYNPETYGQIIINLVKEYQPDIFLIGSSFMGRELAPILAAKLQTGLTAHCINLVLGDDNILDQQIPAYGGLISVLCPERRPQMATVSSGVFPTPKPDSARQGNVLQVAMPNNLKSRVNTVEIIRDIPDEQSIETAQFVVAGGAGAGDAKGWEQIKELTHTLNGALGCTRPAVDEGWADLETMIGQSGKMVSPQFYLGVGLSGELQHMVGIKGAKMMIAINSDAKSPVFEQVDYGIVEDCRTFVPLLLETIKKYQGKLTTT